MEREIKIRIIDNSSEKYIVTYAGEYDSLMVLIRDNMMLDMFGQCGGMGRCATCMVSTKGITGCSLNMERNEPSTLKKYGLSSSEARLSCQLPISNDIHGGEFRILEV